MTFNRWTMAVAGSVLVAVLAIAWNPIAVSASANRAQEPTKPTAPPRPERGKKDAQGKEMTFVGKLVDLQSHMTGQPSSGDAAKTVGDAIRAGVPAAIDTPAGLIVIGQGTSGPSKTLLPLVGTRIQVTGKLYEKGGLKYIDISSARSTSTDPAATEESQE